jgi:glycosyltransferase involved in cell wall biosynthesis
LDTWEHARYFQDTFHLPREKIRSIYVGCDENLFSPIAGQTQPGLVLFYGSFLPVHGVDTIIQAARQLSSDPKIHFKLIGNGLKTAEIMRAARQYRLENVEFLPSVPLSALPQLIAQASVCLGGHFSAVPKARRVIAGKTFQCLAMGKPTIVGANPANRELLTHGKTAWFCEMNDPPALAQAIHTLLDNPDLAADIGAAGRQVLLEKASFHLLKQQVRQVVEEMI